ncbi:type III polyketide synthase [Candidatus Poribacteria bacterium]|nr:type III polyketide synthase [Candidatus Poribacteria bacterium]
MSYTAICAIGTAVPKYQHRQTDVARFMKNALSADAALSRRIDYLYRRSQIGGRYSCIPDYSRTDPAQFEFYPSNWNLHPFPTTQHRLEKYQTEALPLCKGAIADALNQPSAPELSEVTHLIVVSCTGFYAPGLDIHLVKGLGLSPDVQRTLIGFMGCYAAFNGIRLADSICRADPHATVLLVCIELCTLHFQQSPAPHHLIANCIFADGAAALFCRRASFPPPSLLNPPAPFPRWIGEGKGWASPLPSGGGAGGEVRARRKTWEYCASSRHQSQSNQMPTSFVIVNSVSWIDDDSLDEMTWTIGNTGFEMRISPDIPRILEVNLMPFIQRLLKPSGLSPTDIDFWAVHSGGRSILDTVQQRLNLSAFQIEDSRAVLHEHGNMSSPSVLFVLKRLLQRLQHGEHFRHCVAMAFGPGLTLEACLFEIDN